MPALKKGSTAHHYRLKSKGNCRVQNKICAKHQTARLEHNQAHLKTEECPSCKKQRVAAQAQAKSEISRLVRAILLAGVHSVAFVKLLYCGESSLRLPLHNSLLLCLDLVQQTFSSPSRKP